MRTQSFCTFTGKSSILYYAVPTPPLPSMKEELHHENASSSVRRQLHAVEATVSTSQFNTVESSTSQFNTVESSTGQFQPVESSTSINSDRHDVSTAKAKHRTRKRKSVPKFNLDNEFLYSGVQDPLSMGISSRCTRSNSESSTDSEDDTEYFERLPVDIVENIFSRLPILDLILNLTLVSKTWNGIVNSEQVIYCS